MISTARLTAVRWLLLSFLIASRAQGILFYDTADPDHNTTAPTGTYSDSGWQYEGQFGTFLGTMIGSQYFVTAQHIGVVSNTFVSTAAFNGNADVTYNIDTSANGGVGYWDIAGSDLRVFKVVQTFSSFAQLYTGTAEVGQTAVVNGMGGARGDEVTVGGVAKGWKLTSNDYAARWGTNQITGIVPDAISHIGTLISAQFNALPGTDEAFLSGGDSGGGLFINDGGIWKLAGVNYAVDGQYDTNNVVGDGHEFAAALYDQGGLFIGSDSSGWRFINDTPLDNPNSFYASRVSDNAAALSQFTTVAVPEPGSLLLMASLGMVAMVKRRRHFFV